MIGKEQQRKGKNSGESQHEEHDLKKKANIQQVNIIKTEK